MTLPVKIWGYIVGGVIIAALLGVKMYWKSYPNDNVIEEAAESILYGATGEDIDFTPGSGER